MKKILLVCGAGMSTSILVKKMKEEDHEGKYIISCCDTISALQKVYENDFFLLAPHIGYMKDEFKPLCEKAQIPFMIIDSLDYTKMNGQAILMKVDKLMTQEEHVFHVELVHSSQGSLSSLILLDINKKRQGEEKDWIIEEISVDELQPDGSIDMILLEPQIAFEERNIIRKMNDERILIIKPSMKIYGSFDGRIVLDYIKEIKEKEGL